jgi:2-methylisocitrate lyase-like PEP mutase family enzyme
MTFADLHARDQLFLMPNAWDAGSARILQSLGFEAIATTSSGHAATLGRLDYEVQLEEAVQHAAALAEAVSIPVSVDFENGFADEPEAVAKLTGVAGFSIEDKPEYPLELAAERVAAAAEAKGDLVLTARCEHFLHDRKDLDEVIERLQAFQEAGADVLYAPGLSRIEDVRTVVAEVDRPVNVLTWPGLPPVAELEEAGVRRVSVGGAFAYAAYSGLVDAAAELRGHGTYGWFEQTGKGSQAFKRAVA